MTHTFSDALALVLQAEGGFVNNPRDPGGMTNLGVTVRAWQAWTGKPATEQIMRALTPAMVTPFYQDLYWNKVAGDLLPIALALTVFDCGVNAGPGEAVRMLQGIVGAPADGKCGKTTTRAIETYASKIGLAKLINRYCDARRDFYGQRIAFPVFGEGWLSRVDRIESEALSWAG